MSLTLPQEGLDTLIRALLPLEDSPPFLVPRKDVRTALDRQLDELDVPSAGGLV
jgi:hypothetical protein